MDGLTSDRLVRPDVLGLIAVCGLGVLTFLRARRHNSCKRAVVVALFSDTISQLMRLEERFAL